ncbi:NAD(P)/FAD-dependent oxidoreductase [Sandarakinorhabdus limnophila]|uniref:NAD(P)/FAD-dependent oxidoreductase n=1 Tax=Sandarakinorhabdus limnophila TaxID=210512 RepID=UPI0026F08B70|nr:FAD-dependent monooxygenase [Sandarakinorhabdus limnophila]MCM0031847.1 electron transfer flavoprotein [Sandarakinorhabdus limnophila]
MSPLIIGGGLAGAAAGIDLARSGHAPLLLERETGPHDKICGEFLSGEAVAALAGLGVDARRLGAVPITRVEINTGHRQAAAALPFPALSLSRRVLDEAMLDRAAAAGVAVQRGVSVRGLADDVAQTTTGDIAAPALLLATGKHDVRGLPRPDGPDEIGFKMYFRDPALSRRLAGTVAVTFFDGGYAGLQPVEGGRLNLCLLVNGVHYRELGNWPALLARLTREPALAALGDAEPLLPRPLAISRVPYGHLAGPTTDGLWRLGDQAAVIPSFCGDGMAIALESGRLAATMLAQGASAADYSQALLTRTRRPVRLAMAALAVARHPLGRLAAMAGLSAIPGGLALLARLTRVADPHALAPA